MGQKINTTILVSPLDWGLGHATRCIPIVNYLLSNNCKVIIACDDIQQKLLKKEVPAATFTHLNGYNIRYSKNKRLFAIKIILQLPKIVFAIKKEHKWLKTYVAKHNVTAIISDNRYGLYHKNIPSVFITHQLRIKAPLNIVEAAMQEINYRLIKKFSACWVPDEKGIISLAGSLSHPVILPKIPVFYIGGISRFKRVEQSVNLYQVAILISGPEPQRSLFESRILEDLKTFKGKALLVRGLPASQDELPPAEGVKMFNHLPAKELEAAINSADIIISRSGYTTVMDIIKLKKRSILVPTPGQTEQEYLAKHLFKQQWCYTVTQEEFQLPDVLEKSLKFDYRLPNLAMDTYEKVLASFIATLTDPVASKAKGISSGSDL